MEKWGMDGGETGRHTDGWVDREVYGWIVSRQADVLVDV